MQTDRDEKKDLVIITELPAILTVLGAYTRAGGRSAKGIPCDAHQILRLPFWQLWVAVRAVSLVAFPCGQTLSLERCQNAANEAERSGVLLASAAGRTRYSA